MTDTEALNHRVTRLEQDMSEVKAVLGRLEPMITRIDERTKHLPSSGFVISTVLGVVMLVIAVIALGPQLQSVVGGIVDRPADVPAADTNQGQPDRG